MKFNFTRSASLFVLAFALIITGCDDDNGPTEADFAKPSVSAPGSQEAVIGEAIEITFSIETEAGYASASVTAENGDASITSEPDADAASGDVVVSYTAGSEGAGSVVLTVTDAEGETAEATAVLSNVPIQTTFEVTENITSDVTWENGNTYILKDRIAVEAGATLTIEGGTLVKGEAGSGENATALLVARDAILNANGTADAPIIFTTVADEITPEMIANGNFESPNLTTDQTGFWGGVIILGNAPISVSGGDEASIEGIPSTDTNGLYGGDDPNDSSGSITYVTIRHGGTNIGEGNEINGLSLGGVGSGTTIENISIVANQDDGVEWFGGTVDVTNVIVWDNGDDALDTDQDWQGTVSNVVTISPAGSSMELDGPEGPSASGNAHTIQNVSAFAETVGSELIDVDDNTNVNVNNVLFFGLALDEDGNPANSFSSDYPEYTQQSGDFAITNIEAILPDGSALSDYFPQSLIDDGEVTSVDNAGSASVGADVSVFSWTWASTSGKLADIGLE